MTDLLTAWRAAGRHCEPWFTVTGLDVPAMVRGCGPGCDPGDERHLGDVMLSIADRVAPAIEVSMRPDDEVAAISLRTPRIPAALGLACALTVAAGPLVVFDDNVDVMFVLRRDDTVEELIRHWPW